MLVHELANKARISSHAVRYYTKIGLLAPQERAENGYHIYDQEDLNRLLFITQAKFLGFSLAEIRDVLQDATQHSSPCPRVREIVQHKIKEIGKNIEEMVLLKKRLEDAMREWENMPDALPDGNSICHLVESVGSGEHT